MTPRDIRSRRSSIDVHHLRVFEAVFRLRSVTRAAAELGVTQSALSKSMSVLREHFSDPLFVRTPRGMEPTPRAMGLEGPMKQALAVFEDELRASPQFDPATSARWFAIYCSDMGAVHFLPALLAHAARHAPGVQFQLASPLHADMAAALAAGEADIAIGPYPDFGSGIFQQVLYTDRYVCLVDERHPRVQEELTLERYRAERHVVISAHGTGHVHREVERRIRETCPGDGIAALVPGFLTPAFVVQGSEYIATVPQLSARRFMALGGLRLLPCPLHLPTLEIRQYWHERFHHDPANQWLRGMVFSLFGRSSPSP
jgi:DNA-binding transcriptional LysR family regulator